MKVKWGWGLLVRAISLVIVLLAVTGLAAAQGGLPPETQTVIFWPWMGWQTQDVNILDETAGVSGRECGVYTGVAGYWVNAEGQTLGKTSNASGAVVMSFQVGRYREARFFNGALHIHAPCAPEQLEPLLQEWLSVIRATCACEPEVYRLTGVEQDMPDWPEEAPPMVEAVPLRTFGPELGLVRVDSPVLTVPPNQIAFAAGSGARISASGRTYSFGTHGTGSGQCVIVGFGPGEYPQFWLFSAALRVLRPADESHVLMPQEVEAVYEHEAQTLRELYPNTCGRRLTKVTVDLPGAELIAGAYRLRTH